MTNEKEYPFIIHFPANGNCQCGKCGSSDAAGLFPVHTHGLHEVGMPEMIVDPVMFEPEGIGFLINKSYKYLKKNKLILRNILNGNVVKINGYKIDKHFNDDCVFCYREVPQTFSGVTEAYVEASAPTSPDEKFIQIWYDGDDYVLEDEYFKGGVTN